MDDEQLLEQWRAGDRRAGLRLFERYHDAVIYFFRSMTGDTALELAQVTFMAAVEGRDRIRSSFPAYLFGIAWNVLRRHLNQLAQGRQIDPEVESMANLDPGPSTLVGRRREHRLVQEAIRRLPALDQAALQLHYAEGLKIAEIAEIMGITASAMRTRMQTARQRVEKLLAELDQTMPMLVSTGTGG